MHTAVWQMSEKPGFQLIDDLDDPGGRLLAYSLHEGEVGADDLRPYWARLDAAKKEGRKLRVYAEMHGRSKLDGGAFVEKLRRWDDAKAVIERMAIVGDEERLQDYAKLMSSATRVPIRAFPPRDKEAALGWLREELRKRK